MILNLQVNEKRNISVFLLLQNYKNSGIVMDLPPPLITILAFERKKMEGKGARYFAIRYDPLFEYADGRNQIYIVLKQT